MDDDRKRRQRAVRLSQEAVDLLNARLVEEWNHASDGRRLTRAAMAAFMGVSVGTADRIMGRKGNDRAVLVDVFTQFSIPWDERYCEPVSTKKSGGQFELRTQGSVVAGRFDWREVATFGNLNLVSKRIGVGFLIFTIAIGISIGVFVFANRTSLKSVKKSGFDFLEIGRQAYWDTDYDQSALMANRSLDMGLADRDPDLTANAYLLLGDAFSAKGELVKARANYLDALNIWNTFDHKHGKSSLLEVLAVTEARMGLLEEANEHFNESLLSIKGEGEPEDPPGTLRGLGSVAAMNGNVKLARQLYDASEAASKKGNPTDPLPVDIRALRALLLRDEGQYQESIDELVVCLQFWTDKGHKRWMATTMRQIATVYFRMDKPIKAQKFATDARQLYREVGDKLNAEECTEMLNKGASYCLSLQCRAEDFF